MKAFDWRHMLCPIVIAWWCIRTTKNYGLVKEAETWKVLYLFGLRVAMWRPEGAVQP